MEVSIVDYDSGWPEVFRTHASRIRAALGERALEVEHAGSTSVPGLPAKPVIDIVLIVGDSADEDAYAPELEAAGYPFRLREPEWHEHRLFQLPDVNLHVFSSGCPEVDRMLAFRDWLRWHADDRELYAETKRRLARQWWRCMDDYAAAKSDVVREILSRATA